jgi:amino acid transporter
MPERTGDGPDGELRRGALSLPGVLMQSITHIAPLAAALFFTQFVVSQAGVAAPLAYPIGFLIVLMLAVGLSQLAKQLPSAGGYYTYVARTLGERMGFLTSWMYTLFSPTVGGAILVFMGWILQNELDSEYGILLPWWLFLIGGALLVAVVAYRGIALSIQVLVLLGALEIAIVFALGVWGLLNPGPGGFNLASYDPANARSLSGLALAVVFSLQAFTGWESAAPLAEETADPRRNVPRALIGSVVLLGVFLTVVTWGVVVGWGTERTQSLVDSQQLPAFVLAKQFWGDAWVILLAAALSSVLAVSVATNNVATRMWFAMARAGSLPHVFARVHPVHRTPVNTVALQFALTLAVGFALAAAFGPEDQFFFYGLLNGLAVILIYTLGNVAVFVLYRRERRVEFSLWLHLLFPVLSSAALMYLGYKSLVPLPPAPARWAPLVVVVWLLGGIVLTIALGRADRAAGAAGRLEGIGAAEDAGSAAR